MARAGAIVGSVLRLLTQAVEPGITTKELDDIAYKEIIRCGGQPTFKGYRGFPASICASINEEIVHGIPSKKVLREGGRKAAPNGIGTTTDNGAGAAPENGNGTLDRDQRQQLNRALDELSDIRDTLRSAGG